MANIKDIIDENITTNGKGEITGEKLNEVLNEIIDAISEVSGLVLSTHTQYEELSNIDSLQALKYAFGDTAADEMLNAAMTGIPLNIHHLELVKDDPGDKVKTLYYPVYQMCSPEAGGTGFYELNLRFGGYCLTPDGIAKGFLIEIYLYKEPDSEWEITVKVGDEF